MGSILCEGCCTKLAVFTIQNKRAIFTSPESLEMPSTSLNAFPRKASWCEIKIHFDPKDGMALSFSNPEYKFSESINRMGQSVDICQTGQTRCLEPLAYTYSSSPGWAPAKVSQPKLAETGFMFNMPLNSDTVRRRWCS